MSAGALLAAPSTGGRAVFSWMEIRRSSSQNYSTYYPCTINYFIVGKPHPKPTIAKPLTAALFGLELVDCESLEAGNFGVVLPGKVAAIARSLEAIDLKEIKAAYAKANAKQLAKAEVDDFDLLITVDEPVKRLVAAIVELKKFYKRAVKTKLGIVMFTA